MEKHVLNSSSAPASRLPQRILFVLFLLSLSLLNPWIRGDGVGYYAFLRAPLIQHNLDFEKDYQSANASFREARLDEQGRPLDLFRTRTGHLDNHFTVGPALLWSPFLIVTHLGVLLARAFGASVLADGFSAPYRLAMALATAFYGFCGLLLAFHITRQYVAEKWALLATIAIWWGSSFPVYMYFNPSWSHAHSAFAVALFLWYWHETRQSRSTRQWILLAAIAGLMLNVYYANGMVLMVLVVEAIRQYYAALRSPVGGESAERTETAPPFSELLVRHILFSITLIICLLPTLITRQIVYGHPFQSGYLPLKDWMWRSPALLSVLFSANHGLLSWTPLLLLAIIGVFLFWRQKPPVGGPLLAALMAFYLFISCYPDWAGISSYGNRFFVSLTPIFIIGLGVLLGRIGLLSNKYRNSFAVLSAVLAIFVFWNAGLIFQWGSHLIPARGPISFSEMIHNQFFVVPKNISSDLEKYLFKRHAMMQQIEERDVEQLRKEAPQ